MEGLVILLVEFLALPLAAAMGVLVNLCAILVELLCSLIGCCVRLRSPQSEKPAKGEPPTRVRRFPWRKIVRWGGIGGAAALLLLLATIAIANWFFFERIVRWQLAGVEEKTRIAVTFDSASGNLFSGTIELHDARAVRDDDDVSRFDIAVEQFVVDLSAIDLLFLDAVFERVELRGVRGTYDRLKEPDDMRPRRSFRLERLVVDDALIKIADHTRGPNAVEVELRVDSLVTEPVDSEWVVFDMLFRSNAKGQINGRNFSIATSELPRGRETRWRGDGLPIELLAPYLGGPFDWISSGKMDLDVVGRWQVGKSIEIEMHWDVTLHDIKAQVPSDASLRTKAIARPVVAVLNSHSARLPLQFDLVINRERFHFAASPMAAELGRTVGDAITDQVAALAAVKPEAVKDLAARGWKGVKGFLDKRRKQNGE